MDNFIFYLFTCSLILINFIAIFVQPEVGGLLVRLPLEVELQRNYRHCRLGQELRNRMNRHGISNKHDPIIKNSIAEDNSTNNNNELEASIWYHTARTLIQERMTQMAEQAGADGQLDASQLDADTAETLQLYLDQQETWQEVCLVLSLQTQSQTAVVLNRPMALQLTDALGKMVLFGTYRRRQTSSTIDIDNNNKSSSTPAVLLRDFVRAFGSECAVYVGGPDCQDEPAIVVHGIAHLSGAQKIATGLYQGGLYAAVQGVLEGVYQPLDFRFFVGRHEYDTNKHGTTLDLDILMGKYQPVACARSLALKQCIQLPKPLWHEVLELCGGELEHISKLELLKRDDLDFQIVNDDDDDEEEDSSGEIEYYDGYEIIAIEDDDEDEDDDDEIL